MFKAECTTFLTAFLLLVSDPDPQPMKSEVPRPASSLSLSPHPLRHRVRLVLLHKSLCNLHYLLMPTATASAALSWTMVAASALSSASTSSSPTSPPCGCQSGPSKRQIRSCHFPTWNFSKAPTGLVQRSANFFHSSLIVNMSGFPG